MRPEKKLRNFKLVVWNRSGAEKVLLASVFTVLFTASVVGQTIPTKAAEQQEKQNVAGQIVDNTKEKADKFVIPDLPVTDQNGKERKFYTDLVKDKKVIINFVFTTCKGICPPTGRHFSNLQTALGKKLGTDVFLITITTDPKTDTPEKLKEWTEKFKLNPAEGWTLVTGSVDNITRLLELFTGNGPNTGYHVPSVCFIDDTKKTQNWNYGLAPIEDILRMVEGK